MMNFCFIGDIHLHNSYPYGHYDENGINSRTLDIKKNVDQAIAFAINKRVSCVYFTGDLFESDSKLLRKMIMESLLPLFKNDIPIIIIVGNHDGDGKNFIMDDIRLFSQATQHGKLLIQNVSKVIKKDNVNFLLVPWQLKKDVKKELNEYSVKANKNEKHILIMHYGIDEVVFGADDAQRSFGLNKSDLKFFDSVISGHIHKPQTIDNYIHFVGSVAVKDIGERHEKKRFLYMEIDKEIKVESIPFNDRVFDVIYSDKDGFADKIDLERHGDVVEIRLRGTDDVISGFDKKRLEELVREKGASMVLFKIIKERDKQTIKENLTNYNDEQKLQLYIDKYCEEGKRKEYFEFGMEMLKQ